MASKTTRVAEDVEGDDLDDPEIVMLSDEFPDMGGKSPTTLGGSTGSLHIYSEDVDAAFKRAVDAGATVQMPPMDMFWGDRYCKVQDPFGHTWGIATHKEDLTPDEIGKRQQAWMEQMCAQQPATV